MTSHSDALMQILSQNQAATSLFLEKVIRQVDIGVHDYESGSPQRLSFNIYVMLSGDSTPQGDEISDVLDYEYLISALDCLLYTSPSPRDRSLSRMPSSA